MASKFLRSSVASAFQTLQSLSGKSPSRLLIGDKYSIRLVKNPLLASELKNLNITKYVNLSMFTGENSTSLPVSDDSSPSELIVMVNIQQIRDIDQLTRLIAFIQTIPLRRRWLVINHFVQMYSEVDLAFSSQLNQHFDKANRVLLGGFIYYESDVVLLSPRVNVDLLHNLIVYKKHGRLMNESTRVATEAGIRTYCQLIGERIAQLVIAEGLYVEDICEAKVTHSYLSEISRSIVLAVKDEKRHHRRQEGGLVGCHVILMDRSYDLITPLRHATHFKPFMEQERIPNLFNDDDEERDTHEVIRDLFEDERIPKVVPVQKTSESASSDQMNYQVKFFNEIILRVKSGYLSLLDTEENILQVDNSKFSEKDFLALLRHILTFIKCHYTASWTLADEVRLVALLILRVKWCKPSHIQQIGDLNKKFNMKSPEHTCMFSEKCQSAFDLRPTIANAQNFMVHSLLQLLEMLAIEKELPADKFLLTNIQLEKYTGKREVANNSLVNVRDANIPVNEVFSRSDMTASKDSSPSKSLIVLVCILGGLSPTEMSQVRLSPVIRERGMRVIVVSDFQLSPINIVDIL